MNIKIMTAFVISALIAPVTGYAADAASKDKPTVTEKVKENVSDAVITTRIKSEFAKDKQVSVLNIKVDTDDKGVVTLSGGAKSKAEADKAVRIARDTKGVTAVKNDIVIGTTMQNAKKNVGDAVITAKIKTAFAKDKGVSVRRIKVNTDDKGVVTLSGNARSQLEADNAVKIAGDTKGVTSVTNHILISAASAKK
jgi:hyperosmotically inducible protein